jgi:hypothetical protein
MDLEIRPHHWNASVNLTQSLMPKTQFIHLIDALGLQLRRRVPNTVKRS